jgi:hypothetical protein
VAEQVKQEKALHLKADIGIDHNSQAVEDAGLRRLEVAVFDREPVLDDPGCDLAP